MQHFVALLIAMVLNALANLMMKVGMKPVEEAGGLFRQGAGGAFRIVLTSSTLLAGLTFFALNVGFYMYALQSRSLKISVAYPMMVGGGFALIAVIARFHPALAERLTLSQAAGVVLVLLGIVLIASRAPAG